MLYEITKHKLTPKPTIKSQGSLDTDQDTS